jgi:PTS system sucrose-specific IIC component
MVGGAAGSLFASWMHGTNMQGETVAFGATTYGVTGIPGIPAVNNVPVYLLELLIASGIAFALTWILWKEDEPAAKKEEAAPAPAEAPAEPMPSVIRCAAGEVLQPVKGKVIPLEDIPDETFASGILGQGVGIEPSEGIVMAPFDGVVTSVFDTKHAITLESNGMEMLIHVGINTVNMKGEGFTAFVKDGDTVKAGQKLLGFDRNAIKKAGYSDTVAVLMGNSDDMDGVECGLK